MEDIERDSKAISWRPRVTFALFAFNQERYILEAVESALSQDYQPLEIILTDDASTDRTFDIMKELAEKFSGEARVILRRSDQNIGLASHINEVMRLATGELVVAAAGDDISLPNRVSEIVTFYFESDKPDSIFSDYYDIDPSGRKLSPRVEPAPIEQSLSDFLKNPRIKGAAHAWTKRVFDTFGPLHDDVLCEDQVIPLRAYLLKQPRYLDSKLVQYRRTNTTLRRTEHFRRIFRREFTSMKQFINDLRRVRPIEDDLHSRILRNLERARAQHMFWIGSRSSSLLAFRPLRQQIGTRESVLSLLRRLIG